MTKACVRISNSIHDSRPLAQRLQAADDAWQDFIFAQKQMEEGESIEDSTPAFKAFSRFAFELVDEYQFRKLLLKSFERYLLLAGASRQRTIQ